MAFSIATLFGKNNVINVLKKAFSITDGHDHDGVNSKSVASVALATSATSAADVTAASVLRGEVVTGTRAEIIAGKTIIAPITGKTFTVQDFMLQVSGAFSGATAINIVDTATSAVTVASIAIDALTDGAIIVPGTSGVTLGAGFGAALTAAKGLKIISSSSATAGTSIKCIVNYKKADSA